MSRRTRDPEALQIKRSEAIGTLELSDQRFELLWAPITGPTVVVLLRRLIAIDDFLDNDAVISVAELAAASGVAPSRFLHALARAERFGLIRVRRDVVFVPERVHIPPAELVHRLPLLVQKIATPATVIESDAG